MKPGLLNSVVLLLSLSANAALLWGASHLSLSWALFCMWRFSQTNMASFSLMHESVHQIAARNRALNYFIGLVAGATFPMSVTMQRLAHAGHHLRNRSDLELFDYYLPTQSRRLRNFWLYAGNLFGLYYWTVVVSNIIYALCPALYRSPYFTTRIAPALGFGPFVRDINRGPTFRMQLELLFALAFQALTFVVLDLNVTGYLGALMFFGLHWSVLQYADHAWTARDGKTGAWNLRVLAPFRWVALNYHYHRAHHMSPHVPWYELPRRVSDTEQNPSFWRVYFSLWKGVRPAPPMGSPADLAFLFPAKPKSD